MKKTYTGIIALLFLGITMVISSCSQTLPKAKGPEDQITVIADSAEYYELEPILQQVFSKVIYTPQPENLFHLKQYGHNHLKNIGRTKNVIIIAPLNSGSFTSKYINSLLDSTVKNKVINDSAFVFNKYDLWSKNQLVMILTSPTMDELKQKILAEHENLLYHFQNASDKRLMEMLYHPKYEQVGIEAGILEKHGFIFYIDSDFKLAMNNDEDNFLWIRRGTNSDRERWIFVHWIENASPDLMNKDSVLAIRNRITKKFYTGTEDSTYVIHDDNYLSVKEVDYKGRYCLMTTGLWRMNDQAMGGPFLSYTFYDVKTKRLYMIDGSIYFPKFYKRNIIQQVDVLLRSWIPEYELTAEQKERFKEALE
ncbi:MAG: DUF4837 family protein [Melioribacteraceae bacterium]|nr:DUF4837 family protein [Melioribacteraceae bacterium]